MTIACVVVMNGGIVDLNGEIVSHKQKNKQSVLWYANQMPAHHQAARRCKITLQGLADVTVTACVSCKGMDR